MNSSLVILTIVPAVSFLLCKHMLVAFSSYFKINKNNLSTASSLSRDEDISDDTTCNIPECIKLTSGVDNICELSDCIKHKILIYLPIKEAARTSILSKSWQHTWSTIPNLVVDCNIWSNSPQNNDNVEESRITKLVDQFFSCHKGNLYKFKLSGTKLIKILPTRWMQTLSEKQISELILEPNTDKFLLMDIGNSFSRCLNLKVLVLSRCYVFLPSNGCDGFKLLHTIDLRDCAIHEVRITGLLSLCPLLEKLTVKPSCFDQILNIKTPKLRELIIYGAFTQVSLTTPNLRIANFVTPQSIMKATPRTVGLRGDLIKIPVYIFGNSSDNQENDVSSCSTFCYIFWNYPRTLNYPMTMVMILAPEEHYVAHELFKAAPTLQKLKLYLEPVDPSFVSNVIKVQDEIFPCLIEATITPFSSSKTVFEFAEMILSNAPLLERLTIKCQMEDFDVFKLNKIHKLSTKAEIIVSNSCFSVDGKHQCCCCPECEVVAW